MADFCTKCSEDIFGKEVQPEIDVRKEFEALPLGMMKSGFICEGCGLIAIARTKEGELSVLKIDKDWEDY